MLNRGEITYDLLWSLWKPNELIITDTHGSKGEHGAFELTAMAKGHDPVEGRHWKIEGVHFGYDGERYGYGHISVKIPEFPGTCPIIELPCYPLRYHQNKDTVLEELKARGKKFVSLHGTQYKSYSGPAFRRDKDRGLTSYYIRNSRVMLDPANYRRENANLELPILRSRSCYQSRSTSKGGEDGGGLNQRFTDKDYIIAYPTVQGFSLKDKMWGEMLVSGIEDIEFDDDAWDSLKLESETKDVIKALVESRMEGTAGKIDDVIRGKGRGLVSKCVSFR
jgi:hypothetical protein